MPVYIDDVSIVQLELVSNLSVASGKAYQLFDLAVGQGVYIDRSYGYLSPIPLGLGGAVAIRTANDDKLSSGSNFLTFYLTCSVTVYVAHDDQYDPKPGWLANNFTPTGQYLEKSQADGTIPGQPLQLWSRDYQAGTVSLGGNVPAGTTNHYNMYAVIVAES